MMRMYNLYYKLCLGRVDIVSYIVLFFICCFIDVFIAFFTKIELNLVYMIGYILSFIFFSYLIIRVQSINLRSGKNRCLSNYKKYFKLHDLPIYYKSEYKEYAEILKEFLCNFTDKEIYKKFISKGFIIVIDDRGKNKRYKGIAGYFHKFDKKIIVFTEGTYGKYSRNTFIQVFSHEFGHFIDYANGNISNNPNFISIYKQCKKNIINVMNTFSNFDRYKYKNRREFFAETFSEFLVGKSLSDDLCIFFETKFI